MKLLTSALLGLSMTLAAAAQAAPIAPLPTPDASIVMVSGGCGPFGHRGPFGGCRANGPRFFRPCPPGFHLGPYRRACRPNFY